MQVSRRLCAKHYQELLIAALNTCRARALLQVPFELLGPVYPLLEQHVAQKLAETYKDGDGSDGVELVVSVEVDRADALIAALADATSGRVCAVVNP
jgi:putative IMPACT (imprinted ancient) family translation regulator